MTEDDRHFNLDVFDVGQILAKHLGLDEDNYALQWKVDDEGGFLGVVLWK